MATLVPFDIAPTGGATLVAADAAGDDFTVNRSAVLVIDNSAGATAKAVTVTSFYPEQPGVAAVDVVLNVAIGAVEIAGGYNEKVFASPGGSVQLTYDDVTDLLVGVGNL